MLVGWVLGSQLGFYKVLHVPTASHRRVMTGVSTCEGRLETQTALDSRALVGPGRRTRDLSMIQVLIEYKMSLLAAPNGDTRVYRLRKLRGDGVGPLIVAGTGRQELT